MSRRALPSLACLLAAFSFAAPANSQILPRRDGDSPRSNNNEIEGTIWEYKVVPTKKPKGEQSEDDGVIRGKLRIKGNAIYEVAEEKARRPRSAEDEHRIGDVTKRKVGQAVETQLRFDDHPKLDGRAVLKNSARQEGGVWPGSYTAKDGTKYKIELRRGED